MTPVFAISSTSNVSKISNNIAGALSNYSGDVFLSSIAELSEIGWWKLVDNSPPLLGKGVCDCYMPRVMVRSEWTGFVCDYTCGLPNQHSWFSAHQFSV